MFNPILLFYFYCYVQLTFPFLCRVSPMQLAKDLLHPTPEEEKRRHKKKRLVQSPNSYFMDVKCPGTLFCTHIGSWHLSEMVLIPVSCKCSPVSRLCSPGCYKITTVFSHAQTVVLCVGCSTVLCQPTGGKARLTEGQYPSSHFIHN